MLSLSAPISPNRRLVIAQVIRSFAGGGAQRVPYDLTRTFGKFGHRSIGIALGHLGDELDSDTSDAEFYEAGATRSPATLAGALHRLRKLFVETSVDVVHVHGTGILPVVFAAASLCRPRPRLCFTWHDSGEVLERSGIRRSTLRFCIRRCDWVSGSSRSVVERLMQNSGIHSANVFHGGVPARAVPPAQPASTTQIAWIARLSANKDPQTLLRAISELRQQGFAPRATLAGSPFAHAVAYGYDTTALSKQLRLDDCVEFVGQLTRPEVERLLSESTIGVQTSHSEGLSLALMEQMMAGLAIVATDVGDTSEAIIHEETGLLTPPGDVDALAEALRRLVLDPALRSRLGAAARARAMEHFSIEAMTRRALREYERVLAERA